MSDEKDSAQYAVVNTISIGKDLTSKSALLQYKLLPYDQITVRKDPNYVEQISVLYREKSYIRENMYCKIKQKH